MEKTIAIIGLGLIGGSLAKAVKAAGGYRIAGFDRAEKVLSDAKFLGYIDMVGNDEVLAQADIALVALHPQATLDFVSAHCDGLKSGAVLIDMCGVKNEIARVVDPLAAAHDFVYIGGHPMAGSEFSGFEYSDAALFQGANMLLVPGAGAKEGHLAQAEHLFYALGFGQVIQTTAELHDKVIAFTSQLAHVVSSAYIKSPAAAYQTGYSAGSYKDLTRVARLNENMWTELFIMNREALTGEIDEIVHHLREYRDAIHDGDEQRLKALLKDGRLKKEEIG